MTPLRIAMVNIPFRLPSDERQWITVPPQGYGGIQWIVANKIKGLLELGHEVFLLGAPGSPRTHPRLTVVPAGEPEDIRAWLKSAPVDVVNDYSCGKVDPIELPPGVGLVASHHMTTRPSYPAGCVYASKAQREQCGGGADAPVIPIGVDPSLYRPGDRKDDFLLFMGRISPFKGALEAAAFARAAGRRLLMAGPAWEPEYLDRIMGEYGDHVTLVGEVGGQERMDLLATAAAILVLSQPVPGPWGGTWCEPGATVVSEAAASGTPVVGTSNGCLAEIVPAVGEVVGFGTGFDEREARAVLSRLPSPAQARTAAIRCWGHVEIARRYEAVYRDVLAGARWS
ncbi:glycosyltransferase [Micromonospora sp. KC207]|uniref:glycosyltransferase n=1 Tax=Micromonospora sp. KC207 TaxID=2530377 RepID=UPI00104D79A5|nr:glycosyltransferase [Micromonospora sp. KC207]TDC67349.1 glycosyltransferase [Micromonospora sp. KC207]